MRAIVNRRMKDLAREEANHPFKPLESVEVVRRRSMWIECQEKIEQLNPDVSFLEIQIAWEDRFDLLEELDKCPSRNLSLLPTMNMRSSVFK